jgi:hypothetical protein
MSDALEGLILKNANTNPFGRFPTIFRRFWDGLIHYPGFAVLGIASIRKREMKLKRQRLLVQRYFESLEKGRRVFIWCFSVTKHSMLAVLCSFHSIPKVNDRLHLKAQQFTSKEARYTWDEDNEDFLDVAAFLVQCGGVSLGALFPPERPPNDDLKSWAAFDGCLVGYIYEHMGTNPCKSMHAEQLLNFLKSLMGAGEPFGFIEYFEEPGAYIDTYYFIIRKVSFLESENSHTQCPALILNEPLPEMHSSGMLYCSDGISYQ